MQRLAVLFLGMFITLGFLSASDVHAQETTPPPLPYCPATATPTSVIPTFVFPTFDTSIFYTSTPCPGGLCPPTATAFVPTVTPTVTATATPVLFDQRIHYCGPAHGQAPANAFLSCTISADGQRAIAYFTNSNVVGNSVEIRVSNNAGNVVSVPMFMDFTYTAVYAGSTFDTDEALVRGGELDYYNHTGGNGGTRVWTMQHNWANTSVGGVIFNAYANDFNPNHQPIVNGTVQFWINGNQLTPTAMPSPTATVPGPCQEGNPNEGSVDGGGTVFTPPVLVPGSCFVIVPNLTMEVPSIVDWSVSDVPSTIGIPGVEICTQYWSMNLSFMGFNVINAISVVVGFVCVAIIYRTFQN